MSEAHIQLKESSVSKVPFQIYEKDFTFLVNGKEFPTTKIISDILSPKICKIHLSDPIFDSFTIETQEKGDFNHILNLIFFEKYDLPEDEIPFFSEIIEILGSDSFSISFTKTYEITSESVISLLQNHQDHQKFYSSQIENEINYICEHFYELSETHKDDLLKLKFNILDRIISSPTLLLKNEDQLLYFINKLCEQNPDNMILYEHVDFLNVTASAISEIASNINANNITNEILKKILARITQSTNSIDLINNKRYMKQRIDIPMENEFSGIMNYLNKNYKEKIGTEIKVIASSSFQTTRNYDPMHVIVFDDRDKYFASYDEANSYLCFDFGKFKIIPTKYTFKSRDCGHYIKKWKIEVSNDFEHWKEISQEETDAMNQAHVSHTFDIKNPNNEEIRYFKITQTGHNSRGDNYFCIDSIEIYGTLIFFDE